MTAGARADDGVGRRTEMRILGDAREFAVLVYQETACLPHSEEFGLKSQMRRAAVSIGSNIAEGADRRSDDDFARFVAIAEGSASELAFQLNLSHDLEFIDAPTIALMQSQLRSLRRKLDALHNSLTTVRD